MRISNRSSENIVANRINARNSGVNGSVVSMISMASVNNEKCGGISMKIKRKGGENSGEKNIEESGDIQATAAL